MKKSKEKQVMDYMTKATQELSTEQKEVKAYMLQASNINDWNARRDIMKEKFGNKKWFPRFIDQSGLIKQCNFTYA